VHLKLKKYSLAALYFSKSLKLMQKSDQQGVLSSNPLDAVTSHSSIKVGEICYNYGISLFKCKKYEEAFRCFYKASSLLRHMPRLWYHMGMCCIHKQRDDSVKAGSTISESDVCHEFKGYSS
jgi:hypothetical protein